MKRGLVLEGGGLRGLFTMGIIDVFLEEHISFDGAIGVSAGAAFGCNLKSEQIGRALRYNLRFAHDPRYCSILSFLLTGDLFGGKFCYHRLPDELDVMDKKTYDENPLRFYVVATDVETGFPVYKELSELNYTSLEWMRASASMPVVSNPVGIDGGEYLDGGVSDSIPVKYFQNIGYEKNVVILTQPRNYHKTRMPVEKLRFFLQKYPAVLRRLAHRHEDYNKILNYIKEQEKLGRLFVLAPEEPLSIGRTEHNRKEIQKAYDQGRALAKKKLDEIRLFLKETSVLEKNTANANENGNVN